MLCTSMLVMTCVHATGGEGELHKHTSGSMHGLAMEGSKYKLKQADNGLAATTSGRFSQLCVKKSSEPKNE